MSFWPSAVKCAELKYALVPSEIPGGIARFVDRLFGGEEEGVAVSTTYSGTSTDDNQYVIVDASEQEPGSYELVVRVRDTITGTLRESRRTIVLED